MSPRTKAWIWYGVCGGANGAFAGAMGFHIPDLGFWVICLTLNAIEYYLFRKDLYPEDAK